MRIEHLAIMAVDPPSMARWYVEHLGFTIKRSMDVSPFGHFLADDSGQVMLEIYNNPAVDVPDYRAMNPLLLHLALVSTDVAKDRQRLLAAGGGVEGEVVRNEGGDEVAFVRDPWGFTLQLVKRAVPMV